MVRSGPGCKLVRGEAAQARVRPVLVVVDPPFFDDAACRRHAAEQVLIEALIAEAAVNDRGIGTLYFRLKGTPV